MKSIYSSGLGHCREAIICLLPKQTADSLVLDHKIFLFARTNRVMDTRRCLGILELESVTSPEALKRAYRDMVLYKQHGGLMGIERDRVKKIVEKQTTQ